MPEYILFHQMSGQGIFNFNELKFILKKILISALKKFKLIILNTKIEKIPQE